LHWRANGLLVAYSVFCARQRDMSILTNLKNAFS
jgi:hypothetical protein